MTRSDKPARWASLLLSISAALWVLSSLLLSPVLSAQPASAPAPEALSLTLEQQVGQLVHPGIDGRYLRPGDPQLEALLADAAAGHIGGIVLFAGDPLSTRFLVDQLQAVAPIPLLVSSDYEWGAAMRVAGATRFPRALSLAASGVGAEDLVRQLARVTAREASELGVGLVLAPVADLWTEPLNTVIASRSFGSEPEGVARLVAAYVDELDDAGLLGAVKHFPGHGATVVDSHLGLPVLEASEATLRRRELVPFVRAIEAGATAIMAGHIAVPALDGRSDRPVSRSPEVLEGLLREELGFRGLIVSDALDMVGAGFGVTEGQAAVEAVAAGVDVLLKPASPSAVRRALLEAVESGRLDRDRVADAARRVLQAKAGPRIPNERAVDVGGGETASLFARAVTVLETGEDTLPLSSFDPPRVRLLMAASEAGRFDVLRRQLEWRTEVVVAGEETVADERQPFAGPAPAEEIVVLAVASASSEEVAAMLEAVGGGLPTVVVGFGSPHRLSDLPEDVAVIAAYEGSEPMQSAVAAALFAERDVEGVLPIATERWPVGSGLKLTSQSRLQIASPQSVGLSAVRLEAAVGLLQSAIEDGAMPGASVLVARRGRLVLQRALGAFSYDEDAPRVKRSTRYDLASLTKVVVTTTLAMRSVEMGLLDLDVPVATYLPEFAERDTETRSRVLVGDLLSHSSGVLWWTDLYARNAGLSRTQARRAALAEIYELPLQSEPGTEMRYSDLGLLLLGEILERLWGEPLDVVADREIFRPLDLPSAGYRPAESQRSLIPPTEDDPWRGVVVQGEVHDENAASLGGVAAHAGLFADAVDLGRFGQMMLNGGTLDGRRFLSGRTVARFTSRAERVPQSSRALGWDTPSSPSSAGRYFSNASFGHTGFTGTSLWIDPELELVVVLLTNRVHPTRENRKLVRLRGRFHDAVAAAVDDRDVAPVRE
ncbi:MAG: glycoside hydrolase family 3 N-terminal domain-containing protein [Acidobacteriota bacterium]